MKAFLIVLTSAWSGQATNVNPFPTMEECRSVLAEMKVAAQSGNAVAAYCSPTAPEWWFEHQKKHYGKDWR